MAEKVFKSPYKVLSSSNIEPLNAKAFELIDNLNKNGTRMVFWDELDLVGGDTDIYTPPTDYFFYITDVQICASGTNANPRNNEMQIEINSTAPTSFRIVSLIPNQNESVNYNHSFVIPLKCYPNQKISAISGDCYARVQLIGFLIHRSYLEI
jgi:hypothetical protein